MSTNFEPRILVRDKYKKRYVLWIYRPKDWEGDTIYTNNFEIIAWAYTLEERNALNATVEYHEQLMKEIENA
jgi:hypothetical protein